MCWGTRGVPGVVHSRSVHETERFRRLLVVGARTGLDREWYLGHGLCAGLDLGVTGPEAPGLPFQSRLRLTWFPWEGVSLTVGYDLLSGWRYGWKFQP
jgi:hypothetical protein